LERTQRDYWECLAGHQAWIKALRREDGTEGSSALPETNPWNEKPGGHAGTYRAQEEANWFGMLAADQSHFGKLWNASEFEVSESTPPPDPGFGLSDSVLKSSKLSKLVFEASKSGSNWLSPLQTKEPAIGSLPGRPQACTPFAAAQLRRDLAELYENGNDWKHPKPQNVLQWRLRRKAARKQEGEA